MGLGSQDWSPSYPSTQPPSCLYALLVVLVFSSNSGITSDLTIELRLVKDEISPWMMGLEVASWPGLHLSPLGRVC